MEQVVEVMKAVGLPPAMAGTALVLALLIRFGRGMLHWMNSELTYLAAILFGVSGGFLEASGAEAVKVGLALTCALLILQKVLEQAAKVVPWLPQDNEWVKVEKP